MLFYVQMKWNYQGRISQDQLWDMEAIEGEHGIEGIRSGVVKGLYKVASQHRVIAIVDVDSIENLDRNSMGWLPMREFLEFEQVWALRDYEGFIADVRMKFPAPGAAAPPATPVEGVGASAAGPEMTRAIANRWFAALKAGNGAEALACLDKNVLWINNPPDKGLSDIVPWLGEYKGRDAVAETFVIWNRLSAIKQFELRELVINGDEAFAVVHEAATIKPTGLDYDIEFIQRLRVVNNQIVVWKSYWDTSKGIVAFRGDMHARLISVAAKSELDGIMSILPFGGDANTVDEHTGQTILMIASARGNIAVIEKLLEFGADPNAVDRRAGASALHKACQGGHLPAVKVLVEAGALIDHQTTTTGHTPLVEAIWFGSDQIVDYLLARDARIELKTYYGFTIDDHINYAIRVNKVEAKQAALARIKNLVAKRRERDQQRRQSAALINAVLAKNLTAAHDALRNGSNVEERYPIVGSFEDGHTPLLVAARDGQTEIVKVLLEVGADVNAVEPVFGAVPLHKATYNGYGEIARLLVKAPNVNLNYQGPSNGYTPLHDALWHGFADCAQTLIEAGARLDIVAYDGKLPVDIAIESFGENHPIVASLRSRSA